MYHNILHNILQQKSSSSTIV